MVTFSYHPQKKPEKIGLKPLFLQSTPERTRTSNPLIRSQMLYPVEPRARVMYVAGEQGFEPRPADPETTVLPLDDSPVRF